MIYNHLLLVENPYLESVNQRFFVRFLAIRYKSLALGLYVALTSMVSSCSLLT